MVCYCSLYGCKNNSKSHPHLSFFTLPKDERKKKWTELMDRNDLLNINHSKYYVCSIHFSNDTYKNKRLKSDAVPSLHLPVSNSCSDQNIGNQVNECVVINQFQVMGRKSKLYFGDKVGYKARKKRIHEKLQVARSKRKNKSERNIIYADFSSEDYHLTPTLSED